MLRRPLLLLGMGLAGVRACLRRWQ